MRRETWILLAFVVGLALHNIVMAQLWHAGVRGDFLQLVSAWKEALLALGILLVAWPLGRLRSLRLRPLDWLAVLYGALVLVYGVIPQHLLGGTASRRGDLLALREDLLPVACYAFGRGLSLGQRDRRVLAAALLATGAALALFGIVDIYAIPLSWWRTSSGVKGWFMDQLGLGYGPGLSGLPQNFVYNTGGGHPYRRLVSTFLSPLATSYLLVVALLLTAIWRPGERLLALARVLLACLLAAALLLTHARSSWIALALGFALMAALLPGRRRLLLLATLATVVLGLAFVKVYTDVAPATTFTAAELKAQNVEAHEPGAGPAVDGFADASIREHWQSLRSGVSAVIHHPQGYGPGNAGSSAARTDVEVRAGESTYTELGIDAGLAGALLFVIWSLALLAALLRANALLAAAFLAMLALGLQTDIIGTPWVVYVVWTLAGWSVSARAKPATDVGNDGLASALLPQSL